MTNQAKPCDCTHTHTHGYFINRKNKLENITKRSNVICHEIKEYVK